MNVTFHTLSALATAAVLGSGHVARPLVPASDRDRLPVLAIGFAAGVVLHGLLDYAPHSYPINSGLDVILALALFASAVAFAKRQRRGLIGSCFLGSIFPDLVDLGPPIVNKLLGWSLPTVKVFPWHWHRYSGSVYDGSRSAESFLLHAFVISVSSALLYTHRRALFVHGEDPQT